MAQAGRAGRFSASTGLDRGSRPAGFTGRNGPGRPWAARPYQQGRVAPNRRGRNGLGLAPPGEDADLVKPAPVPAPSKGAMEPVPREDPVREQGPSPESAVRELVARAQGGDEAAFRTLVILHQDRAYGLALRITRSPADAEEVAQDAFVRAWSALPRFRGESRFGTWLHRIVARRALDRVEELKRRGGRELRVADEAALPEPAEAGRDPGDTLRDRAVERLVAALPAAQRTAVTLYYYEDRSVEQVAVILGMPENTVKTHLSRARAALRAALEGERR